MFSRLGIQISPQFRQSLFFCARPLFLQKRCVPVKLVCPYTLNWTVLSHTCTLTYTARRPLSVPHPRILSLTCCNLLYLITSVKRSLIISFQELIALFAFITHLTYLIVSFFFLCRICIFPFQSDKSPLEDHFLLVFKFLTVLLHFQFLIERRDYYLLIEFPPTPII